MAAIGRGPRDCLKVGEAGTKLAFHRPAKPQEAWFYLFSYLTSAQNFTCMKELTENWVVFETSTELKAQGKGGVFEPR